jgi:3-oxoadipate enol-lactonase
MAAAASASSEPFEPFAPPLPPGRYVDLPGRGRTWVRELPGPADAAAKPTIVLLHGLVANADLNWFPSYEPLGREFRVVALDHRGHGRGIRVGPRFRLADCADDVAALAGVLGLERIVPVGYSMGGPIAQLVWHRHRSLVAGLVLCATSRNFWSSPRTQIAFNVMAGASTVLSMTPWRYRRAIVDRIVERRIRDRGALADWAAAELRRNDPATIIAAAGALGRFSSHEWIGGVDVPTAVIVTTQDSLVAPHRQRKLAAAIPGAELIEVAGDHGAGVERPDLFVPALLRACRSVTARATSGSFPD